MFSRVLVRRSTFVIPRRLYSSEIDTDSLINRIKKSRQSSQTGKSRFNQKARFQGKPVGSSGNQRFQGTQGNQGNEALQSKGLNGYSQGNQNHWSNRSFQNYKENTSHEGGQRDKYFKPNNRDKYSKSDRGFNRREPIKPQCPKWEYGTDLEKGYMNKVFKQIYEINGEGRLVFINDKGEPEKSTLIRYMDLIPGEQVLGIVDIQEQDDEKVALVKTFPRRTKLQEYSDKQAEEKTKIFGRAKKSKRKDTNLKNVKVSWEISQSDLDNQKANEIVSHLKKGYKILLVIGRRREIGVRRFSFEALAKKHESELTEEEKEKLAEMENEAEEEEDEEEEDGEGEQYTKPLNQFEEAKRTKVLDQVRSIFQERATFTVKGDIKSRIMINAEPLKFDPQETKQDEKRRIKEQKKSERQMKEKLRLEKKKAKTESQKIRVSSLLEN